MQQLLDPTILNSWILLFLFSFPNTIFQWINQEMDRTNFYPFPENMDYSLQCLTIGFLEGIDCQWCVKALIRLCSYHCFTQQVPSLDHIFP
jgi:hypothetical protein